MRFKFIFPIVIICLYANVAKSQEARQKFIGIETGMNFIGGKMSDMDHVRGDVPSYSSANPANNLTSLMYSSFVGIKPEYFSLNNKFGFGAGLRYSHMISTVGRNDYWSDNTNYFYWLYRQEGINTEYLKIKEINQKSDYIGIPVEVRYFPFKPHLFKWYVKAGADISFKLKSQTDVVFFDDAMEPYQNDVAAVVGKPGSVISSLYWAWGVKIGSDSKPSVSFEICLPTIITDPESPGLVNATAGSGFQLNVQIPFK
jgi:hypothetical protein